MKAFCKGVTKNGEPCRITANLVDGYCRLHREPSSAGVPAADALDGKKRKKKGELVLERSPTTGFPRYVECDCDPKSRWVMLMVVSVAVLLTAAMSLIFCRCRRCRCKNK